ncbi:murein biosynthesis integral membrane protein MurJ [Candidatus Peregrinibacteria bacterium]|nr:murein biosynthesis integral membrane protein MurJ [Candidatus Peregrinibacteria bacterium]
MRKKFFKPIKIGSATALIAVASFLSYAIGLIRDRIIAVNFGTTNNTDIYNASFLIPDMLFNLFIAGALVAAFMPVFSQYLAKDKDEAFRVANTVLTGGTLLIGLLSIFAFIFMEEIIPFLFPEAPLSAHLDIINMTRLMLPSAVIFAISNTLGNILMCYKHFFSYAISPILYNLGIILGIIFLSERFGIYSAAIGVIIGAFFHAAIRIIDIFMTEYRYKTDVDFNHSGFKKIIRLMIPKSISLIAWQINLYIFALVGMRIVEGGLAAFNFARNIQSFAVSLFGISFATAVFPYLASTVNEAKDQQYTAHIQKTIQRILFFTIPSMAGIMVLSTPLVELILSGGVFDENSTKLTSLILFYFALSIPFEAIVHILARSFYAIQNTLTPMILNLIAMGTIAAITYFVAPIYGVEWFSIGFSIGIGLQVILLIIFLWPKLKGFDVRNFFISLSKIALCTLIMTTVILSTEDMGLQSIKLTHILRIILGTTAYFSAATILKSDEVSGIKYIISRAFKK